MDISEEKLLNLIIKISENYIILPYHNFIHAF